MKDILFGMVIAAIVTLACLYIWKEKKKGNKCIGCPLAGSCHKCSSSSKPVIHK